MFFTSNKEEQIDKNINLNETKIRAMSIQLENLNREIDEFFGQLQLNIDNLSSFMSNKNNFTEQNWDELNKQKQLVEEKLQRELDNIRNPLKTKASQASQMHVQRHWLYVK